MNVVFRVDASNLIGTGHVIRCRTLASALRLRGAHIRFITRKHSGHMSEALACEGFQVELLPEPDGVDCEIGYAGWLGVSQEEDAKQTIVALNGLVCDLLVVDHYALDSVWERLLREHTSKIMVIDDLANRVHDCDVFLDQNYSLAGPERYRPWVPASCQLLLGPRYALLRPEYAKVRESMTPRTGSIQRILIYMGGSEDSNITGLVMSALKSARLDYLHVDVVVGPNFKYLTEVMQQVKAQRNAKLYSQLPHLADLMSQVDLAVGAGGATTWERLCLGVESLVVSIADNQVPACKALASSGLIQYLGDSLNLNVSIMEAALIKLTVAGVQQRTCWHRLRSLVDGRGTNRVAEVLIPTPVSSLKLRKANETDALTYYVWANDPVTRASAINSKPIDLDTHLKWFKRYLSDENSYLYILEAEGLPVGQVRFDRQAEEVTIDYSLDALVRGRRWAQELLGMGIESLLINIDRSVTLCASVKRKNIPSASTFLKLDFLEEPFNERSNLRSFKLKLPKKIPSIC